MYFLKRMLYLSFLTVTLTALPMLAHATRLEVAADSPLVFHLGATILLYSHITGGAIGIITGVIVSVSRKGSKTHRNVGKVFFVSMGICYFIGALVSPFLHDGQRPNFIASVLALYLLLSGIQTARRKPICAGLQDYFGFFVAVTIATMGVSFVIMANASKTGTVDGSPPDAFILFIVVGSIAGIGELNIIIRKTLSEKSRLVRHLWRMCCSFFIATGSFFFGQSKIFPPWFNDSLLSPLAVSYPLIVILIWVLLTRIKGTIFAKKCLGNSKGPLIKSKRFLREPLRTFR